MFLGHVGLLQRLLCHRHHRPFDLRGCRRGRDRLRRQGLFLDTLNWAGHKTDEPTGQPDLMLVMPGRLTRNNRSSVGGNHRHLCMAFTRGDPRPESNFRLA